MYRYSLLRITWIEAEDISKAIEIFSKEWREIYPLHDVIVIKQRDTFDDPKTGPRYDIVADSVQEWLDKRMHDNPTHSTVRDFISPGEEPIDESLPEPSVEQLEEIRKTMRDLPYVDLDKHM